MRVLLVATNRQRSPFPVAPLGALAVAAAARRAGHQVDLLDMMFVRWPERALRKALKSGGYQAVGLSIRNLDNCIYAYPRSYAGPVVRLAELVRRLSAAPLVLGGSGFSVAPGGWMRRTGATYGVVGEGEQAFVELLCRLEAGRSPQGLEGVVCGDAGRQACAASRPDADGLPQPAHGLCNYGRYLSRGGFVGIQSKRGCPYKCIYCNYPLLEGACWRLRPAQQVVQEMMAVADQAAKGRLHYYFTDSVFNCPRDHAMTICDELTRRRSAARWMAYCNPAGFDSELASAMSAAGCVGVEFGIDAVSEKMLSALGKHFTPSDIRRSLQAAADARLPFSIHLLFGGPGETLEDIEQTRSFLDASPPANAVFASVGLRVYEGTPLEQIARREGRLDGRTDLFEPVYYVSPGLGRDPMGALDAVARTRAEWSTSSDWSRWVLRALQALANRGPQRPQWLNARNYGKYLR